MNYEPITTERVLALDPTPRGFGFVVLENQPFQLVDWGVATCKRGRNSNCLSRVERLVGRHKPSVLVLEDWREAKGLRRGALEDFIESIADILVDGSVEVRTHSRSAVQRLFAEAGAMSKEDIAKLIAGKFPELLPRVPPRRKIWMSEDYNQAVFDAAALAVAHLIQQERK